MKVTTDSCLFGAWTAEKIKQIHEESMHVLDIGTGTGLLSLMLAQNINSHIDAIEIDREAFEQAMENVEASIFSRTINIIHGDARIFVSPVKYDFIISNPPFYENELKSGNIKKNKAHHHEGLLMEDLFSIIKEHLQPAGTFYLLLPYKRNNELRKIMAKYALVVTHCTLVRQSIVHPYFRIMVSGKHKEEENQISSSDELAIKNEINEYSPEFISLLKEYYLHL